FDKPRGYLLHGEQNNGQATNGEADNIDALPMPAPPAWPKLGDAALHGLAGDLIRQIEPHTEADIVALLIQFLTAFGSIIGRKAHCLVEGFAHHGNLFACLVGDSSRGRKGTASQRILQLFAKLDNGIWSEHCQAHGLSSGEGLIWAVRDKITETRPVEGK